MFVDWHDTSGDGNNRKQVAIDGKICALEILELSIAPDIFSSYWLSWVQALDGIVIVYSIDSRSSFVKVRDFYTKIVNI